MSGNDEPKEANQLDAEKTIPIDRPKRRLSGEVTIPISSGSREPTEIFEPDALEARAVRGPLRRNLPLIVAVIVVLLAAPAVSRLLSSYRAVVLEIRDGQMLLIEGKTPPPPPRWVREISVEPGAIVEKSAGAWEPMPVEGEPLDQALLTYYRRWTNEYEGVIKEIRPPEVPGAPNVAIVTLTDGSTIDVSLWSQDLAGAAVGKGLRKRSGSWEPDLMEVPPTLEEDAPPGSE